MTPLAYGALAALAFLILGSLGLPPKRHRMPLTEKIAALTPRARNLLEKIVLDLRARGIRVVLGETWRSGEKQAEYHRAGRSARELPGPHTRGEAFDLYIVDPETNRADTKGQRRDLYAMMHESARRHGGRVLGYREIVLPDGRSFRDPFHVEVRS
jgi:hypothetical protein